MAVNLEQDFDDLVKEVSKAYTAKSITAIENFNMKGHIVASRITYLRLQEMQKQTALLQSIASSLSKMEPI